MQKLQVPVVVLPATIGRSMHYGGKGDITLGGVVCWEGWIHGVHWEGWICGVHWEGWICGVH